MPPAATLPAEIAARGQDHTIDTDLAVMCFVRQRLLDALAALDDTDGAEMRRLAQTIASVTNTILRVVQARASLANPRAELDAEIAYAFAVRGLDGSANMGADYRPYDTAVGFAPLDSDVDRAGPDPADVETTTADRYAVIDDLPSPHDWPDRYPAFDPQPPRQDRVARAANTRSRLALGVRGRHPPDGR